MPHLTAGGADSSQLLAALPCPPPARSTAVGTVEFRSLLEPVRTANPFVNYFEASCDRIDLENKVSPRGSGPGGGAGAAPRSGGRSVRRMSRDVRLLQAFLEPYASLPPGRAVQLAYCTSQNAYLDGRRPQFEVAYDILVVAVGEQPATFNTPGVEEHCFFMKASRGAAAALGV